MVWWRWHREALPSAAPGGVRRPERLLPYTGILTNRLVAECEAFLSGRLIEQVDTVQVPVWSWTNLLAHGREEDLRAVSLEESTEEWRKARAYLAASLLALASTYGPLEDIQRRVLVPLELELAARPEVAAWEPRGWASAVEHSLEGYRRQCRRSVDR